MKPERELSILVQACRLAYSDEEDVCNQRELLALDQWEKSHIVPHRYRAEDKFGPPQTNSWFVISDTSDGLKAHQVFRGLDQPLHSRRQTNCLLLGSHLYDIGGVGTTRATSYRLSSKISILDTRNPNRGWKTHTLPFSCADAAVAASGDLIYLFPHMIRFTGDEWAYIYDMIKQEAFPIKLPPNCAYSCPSFCIPLDGRGVIVPVGNGKGFEKPFLHDGVSCSPLNSYAVGLLCHQHNPRTISNGILYVAETNICTVDDGVVFYQTQCPLSFPNQASGVWKS